MHDVAKPTSQERTTKRSWGPLGFAIGGVLALLVLLGGIKFLQINKMMGTKMDMPPTTVTSITVQDQDWASVLTAIGSVSPVQGAVVSSELGGVVAEVRFQNGSVAKKGDILVKLAATTEDADLELARKDLARARDLASRRVISKAELDAAESKFKQMTGALEKKEVRAPFDGMLGIRQVNVGQMIKAGDQVVSLQALDPVYVDFALPQQNIAQLAQGLEVKVTTDAVEGREFTGKLTAINSAVDEVTRNVSAQATLTNTDHALRPGMFVKVSVILAEKEHTLVVPGTAISYAPYGDSVFVIEKKKDEKTGKEVQTLRQQFVRVGTPRGDWVAVKKGLKAGETVANGVLEAGQSVVSTGVFKLRNGMPVAINNDLAPKPQMDPKPPDS